MSTDTGGGPHPTAVDPGDHIAFDPVNLGDADTVTLRYSGGSAGTVGAPRAAVELRLDSPTGPVVATSTLPTTSGNNAWASRSVPVDQLAEPHRPYLVFRSVTGGPAGPAQPELGRVRLTLSTTAGPSETSRTGRPPRLALGMVGRF